ncbi:hypothetical protein ISCGN_009940 [Ixodes scapularis]
MRHNRRGWRVRPLKEPGMDEAIDMGEFLEAVNTTKTNSAPGPDSVTYTALKKLPAAAEESSLEEYNRIWDTGELPSHWKLSWVTPTPKPGNPQDKMENFRPVSLTSNVCKAMEKIVLRRIQWYLETYDRLDARQTGFRQAMGTQNSLKLLYDVVMADKDATDPRLIVALDIKKAYDEVPHWAVIQGAKDCGVRDFLGERHVSPSFSAWCVSEFVKSHGSLIADKSTLSSVFICWLRLRYVTIFGFIDSIGTDIKFPAAFKASAVDLFRQWA